MVQLTFGQCSSLEHGSGSWPRGADADTSALQELKKLRRELRETRAECKRLRSFSGNRDKSRSPVRTRGKAVKRSAGSFRPGAQGTADESHAHREW